VVTIPPELSQLWTDSAQGGKGIRWIDDLTFEVVDKSAFLAVSLPAKAEYPIQIYFEDTARPEAPNKKAFFYDFDVVMHRDPGGFIDPKVEPLGGVTYDIVALDTGGLEP
jgi:hypothetical protein